MRKATILLLAALLLLAPATATYYADSIDALGHNGTFSGLFVGSRSTNNYISTSPTGSGNATLYIGNARIITEGMSLNPAGGWYDNGGVVALEDPSDHIDANALYVNNTDGSVGIGTTNPLGAINNLGLQVDHGGHTAILIGDGTNDGGVIQSSDNIPRVFIGANVYDDSTNSWQQFDGNKGYAGIDAVSTGTNNVDGMLRFIVGDAADLGYSSDNIAVQIQKRNASSDYIALDPNNAGFDVGIGTTTPTQRLDVAGNIAVSGTVDGYDISTYGPYFIDSAGASGQVWKSDGAGRGYWAADAGLTAESDTLQTVTDRGATTTNSISVGGTFSLTGGSTGATPPTQLIFADVYDSSGDPSPNKITFWDSATDAFGIGVSSSDLDFFTQNNYKWHRYQGGTVTQDLMTLDNSGALTTAGGLTVTSGTVDFPSNSIASADVNFNYAGSSSKGGAATSALDLTCTDCIGPTEITDSYILNTGDTMGGDLSIGTNDLSWTTTSANFAATPRTTMSPMSIRLWDNYNDGGPTQYGTLLQIYGRSGHEDSQLYFGNDGTIRYRDAFYNENTYSGWETLAYQSWVTAQGYITSEADGSTTNEIQTLGTSGNTITLSLGGGSVTAPYATSAGDADTLDGLDSTWFARIDGATSSHTASGLAAGWYTIATNTGNRAVARFGLRDTAGGRHQSVVFYAGHDYGNDESNTITVLQNSHYSVSPFRYIRIKDLSTYDGAALQVYIDDASNNVAVFLLGDNFQSEGWVLKDWIPDATDPGDVTSYPSFTTASQVDLDQAAQGGIVTTGAVYAGGDTTQYEVWHAGNDGSGSGLDADTVDGHELTTASTGNTVVERESTGDINARLFRSEYDTTNSNIGYIMTQIDTASNNYIRPSTPAQVRTALDIWVDSAGDTMSGTLDMNGNSISGVGTISFSNGANHRITNNANGLVFDGGDGTADFLVYDDTVYSDTLRLGYSGSALLTTYDSGEDLTIDPNGAANVIVVIG